MTAAVSVRLMGAADLERVDGLLQAAFERPTSFLDHVRLTCRLQPDGVFVAERAGALLGTVGAVDYGDVVYVGLMAVTPAEQGRGIGRLLMRHLLAWVDDRGGRTVLLDATDRGALLYETLGFVDDSTAYVYVGPTGSSQDRRLPGAQRLSSDGLSVRWATLDDLDAIVAFDAPRFGADRRKLLTALMVEQRQPCLIARDSNDQLLGYQFVRGAVLGPWVADRVEVAEALLARGLSMCDSLRGEALPQVMVPRSNDVARTLLARHGFTQQRQLRHMRRGGTRPPGRPECLFGQASFAHG